MATYVDLSTIDNPTAGQPILAAWGDQIRENDEFLIDPPAASVSASAAQSVASGTTSVALTANTEAFDNAAWHTGSEAKLTAPIDGRYLFIATVQFAANATGNRRMAFRVDGTTVYESTLVGGTTTNSIVTTAPRMLTLTAGQYVEVVVWQTSGGNLNVTLLEFAVTFLTR
jgi:hypothetical protein